MPAHFEIRVGPANYVEPVHEWVALVGGNGETMMTTETYPIGHGHAVRAVREIIEAVDEARTTFTFDERGG